MFIYKPSLELKVKEKFPGDRYDKNVEGGYIKIKKRANFQT